jgi:hypothetical protein
MHIQRYNPTYYHHATTRLPNTTSTFLHRPKPNTLDAHPTTYSSLLTRSLYPTGYTPTPTPPPTYPARWQ